LEKIEEVNRAEDEEHGQDGDGGEGRHQKSFADPDAQMMKTGDGAVQYAYNAQAAASGRWYAARSTCVG
jgi:hypothetical protein